MKTFRRVFMTSLLLKLITVPLAVVVSSWIFPNVDYGAVYQPIVVGLLLAVIGLLMEYMLLQEGTVWISTLADFVTSVVIVYFVSNLFDNGYVTLMGAVWTSLLLSVIEYFLHRYLVESGKTKKSPA